MTATFTCEIPYAKEYAQCFKSMRGFMRSPRNEALMLTYWLMPEETLLQCRDLEDDESAVMEIWDVGGEDNFSDNPPVDFENDDTEVAASKFFCRRASLCWSVLPGAMARIVYKARPGDVTPEGKEVKK